MAHRLLSATIVSLLAFVVGPGVAAAQADSLVDNLGPREMAVGEALRAAAHGRLSTVLNPAGLALHRTYVIEATYGTRGADDASIFKGSVCDSVTAQVAACLFYGYLDADPDGGSRRFHEVGLTTAVPLGRMIAFGVTQKWSNYDEEGTLAEPEDGSTSGYRMDAGLNVSLGGGVSLAGVGYNLVGGDEDQYPLAIGTGVAVTLSQMILLAADARFNLESKEQRYGGGAELFLAGDAAQAGFAIRGGYVYDTVGAQYATGGLGYVTPRVGLDAGYRRQIADGDENAFEFGLRLFLPN